jgi:hypothetical protein
LRAFIDAILDFIGAASLSDEEFDSLEIESAALDTDTYNAIYAILQARELVSNTVDRLRYYFQAANVYIPTASQAKSNIVVGRALCD